MARAAWVLLAGVALAAGCNGSTSPEAIDFTKDDRVIGLMVENLNEERRPQGYFASSEKLTAADMKKMRGCTFDVVGAPAIDGDSATATVRISPAKAGVVPLEKPWRFVKEAGKWKIKSAPLP